MAGFFYAIFIINFEAWILLLYCKPMMRTGMTLQKQLWSAKQKTCYFFWNIPETKAFLCFKLCSVMGEVWIAKALQIRMHFCNPLKVIRL